MAAHRLLQELTREETRATAPETLVLFPVAATEQHGPHLPLGTDTFTVEHIARESAAVAALAVPIVIAPTMPFGSSHHHHPFGGTMSVTTETYYRVIHDLTESLITIGFRRIFILNGHGGNHELVQLVARELALKHSMSIAATSYWTIAWNALVGTEAHKVGRVPGHAGAFETSQMLAIYPALVRRPLPHRDVASETDFHQHPPYRVELHGWWQAIDGHTDSADRADDARGQRYLEATVRSVAEALVEFYHMRLPSGVPTT